jgi:site-specific DNA-cytosine methylase
MISHPKEPRNLSLQEISVLSSFPIDYKATRLSGYQMGMSVPPLMMHKISEQIKLQLLDKL